MENCVFCRIINRKEPAFIVYEDEETIAFLDKYPQTRGHLQLAPKTHVRWVYDIEQIGSFFVTAKMLIRGIIPVLRADYVRLASFGEEVPHGHLWIVPQYGKAIQLVEGKKLPPKEDLRAV